MFWRGLWHAELGPFFEPFSLDFSRDLRPPPLEPDPSGMSKGLDFSRSSRTTTVNAPSLMTGAAI